MSDSVAASSWSGRGLLLLAAVVATIIAAAVVAALLLTGGDDSGTDRSAPTTDLAVLDSPVLQRVDVGSGTLVATVPIEGSRTDALDAGAKPRRHAAMGGGVWSIHAGQGAVRRLNVETNAIDRSIGIRGEPASVVSDGEMLWLTSTLDDQGTLTQIDPDTGDIVREVGLGLLQPRSAATGSGAIWVIGQAFGTVFGEDPGTAGGMLVRIDRDTQAATAVPLDGIPQDVDAGEDAVWVVSDIPLGVSGLTLDRIDTATNTVSAQITLTQERGLVSGESVSVGEGFVWVAGASNDLQRIDPQTLVVDAIGLGLREQGSQSLRVAVGHGSVWVTTDAGTVVRLDPATGAVLATVQVGSRADTVTIGEREVWVEACQPGDAAGGCVDTLDVGGPGRDRDPPSAE